ncbi:hypothetical protein Tco_0787398 [Tanacetum coccineum]
MGYRPVSVEVNKEGKLTPNPTFSGEKKIDDRDSRDFESAASSSAASSKEMTDTEWLPLRHGKGPSHRKDCNLSAEKGKGRSKQKRTKSTPYRLALGRAHTHEPTLSRIRAPVDNETAIVVNESKAREREVSDAKGNSSTKASVVIIRPSCLIDSPSIIQSRKQSQRPLKKDEFYFKILSWTVKKPKGKKEEQKQRRCIPHKPLTIYPWSLSLRQRDSLFLKQARRYQDKILAEAEKEEEKEERPATITSLDEL